MENKWSIFINKEHWIIGCIMQNKTATKCAMTTLTYMPRGAKMQQGLELSKCPVYFLVNRGVIHAHLFYLKQSTFAESAAKLYLQ